MSERVLKNYSRLKSYLKSVDVKIRSKFDLLNRFRRDSCDYYNLNFMKT